MRDHEGGRHRQRDDTLTGGLGYDTYAGGTGNDTYALFDFGSSEVIYAAGQDTLSFAGKLQNLVYFLTGTTMEVGFDQRSGTPGTRINDFNSQVTVNSPAGVARIIGSDASDAFHVTGTAKPGTDGPVILDGQKGSDKYLFYAGASSINATVNDTTADDGTPSNSWDSGDVIEVIGTTGSDVITVTDTDRRNLGQCHLGPDTQRRSEFRVECVGQRRRQDTCHDDRRRPPVSQ